MSTQHVTLNRSGDKMPLMGFGCWKVENKDAEQLIYDAIKCGYRLFDNACDYGNEVEIGRGIARAIKDGLVKREELFVVTKLWNTFHSKDHVRPAFEKQRKELGLDYIDLYLIHFPVPLKYVAFDQAYPPGWYGVGQKKIQFERAPMHECWSEMEKLVDDGLARNIGISNFNVQAILDLLTYCKHKPATLQVEIHPYLPQKRLVEWVQAQEIHITAYSSFGPGSYVSLTDDGRSAEPLLQNDAISSIAQKKNKTPAQVLLRWAIERGIAVIPKSSHEERMKSNHDVFSWSLDDDDKKQIETLNKGLRFNNPDSYGFDLPLFS
ncbi:xylose reductase [Zychaea mexicana]|uniref:xylose reductase n=1 Tax=Zychaea mexicana TaxID=64656 RepID=UPI0022FDE745|nr:xylose reductase [Zychaea mexicana]KAI9479513.1 xylose reductase [Zychaea mexicana]